MSQLKMLFGLVVLSVGLINGMNTALLDLNSSYESNSFMAAVSRGNFTAAREWFGEATDICQIRDSRGNSALHYLCQVGLSDKDSNVFVKKLLKKKECNLRLKNNKGETPLFCACKKGSTGVAFQLIDCGASINEANDAGLTPLHQAILEKSVHRIEFALSHGADHAITTRDGQSAFTLLVNRAVQGNRTGKHNSNGFRLWDIDKSILESLLVKMTDQELDNARKYAVSLHSNLDSQPRKSKFQSMIIAPLNQELRKRRSKVTVAKGGQKRKAVTISSEPKAKKPRISQ
jgi:ankyrin repeat protein